MDTHAENSQGKRPGHGSGDVRVDRLDELLREACNENGTDLVAAFAQWRDHVELYPELILRVVGEQWQRISRDYFHARRLQPAGSDLVRGAMNPESLAGAVNKRRATAIAAELNLMSSITVGGRPIGICTKAELESEGNRRLVKGRFLLAVAERLPDPDKQVQDFLTVAELRQLWSEAK